MGVNGHGNGHHDAIGIGSPVELVLGKRPRACPGQGE